MFDADVGLDRRRPTREGHLCCRAAEIDAAEVQPCSVGRLPAERVLWSRGDVIALRRRGRQDGPTPA